MGSAIEQPELEIVTSLPSEVYSPKSQHMGGLFYYVD